MAKLPRVFQRLFGLNGAQSSFGQFGSRAANAPNVSKDPATIQSLDAFVNQGWLDAINAINKAPFTEDMNGLFLLLFRQVAYGFQEGIPEWDPATPYYIGGIVKKTGTFELYGSTVNNNVGQALPNQTDNGSWHFLNPPSVAPGIIADFGGITVPFGYLACDGTDYAQGAYPALYAATGNLWDLFNGNISPGAGRFRVPDFRGVTTMGVGAGNGLTPRIIAQFIGEETHTLTPPEMPGHIHPVNDPGHDHRIDTGLVAAGAPNVTAFFGGDNTRTRTAQTGITTQNAGGSQPHNNMQPSGVTTKIIKY